MPTSNFIYADVAFVVVEEEKEEEE